MPSGKTNVSGSENGAVVYQPRSRSQITGGFRHSSIVVQIENVGAKSKPSISRSAPSRTPTSSTVGEEVVGGVAGEHVGETGLDADAHEGEPAGGLPPVGDRELAVAEHLAGLVVRVLGVRVRQVHRHVEVGGPGREGAVEDRRVEARIAGVDHDVGAGLTRERGDRVGVATRRPWPRRGARRRDRRRHASARLEVDVGDRQLVEEVTAVRDPDRSRLRPHRLPPRECAPAQASELRVNGPGRCSG